METGKVWFITGASKGMGQAMVHDLLQRGYKVAATTRNLESLASFSANTERFLPLETDLASDASIQEAFRQTVEKLGGLDVVVNNAGYGLGGALEELAEADIRANFEINFFAAVRVIQQALPYLRRQRSGYIINISSIAGFAPGTGWAAYSAAKAAITGLSQALAVELEPLGIKVLNVLPGFFRTSFAKEGSIVYGKYKVTDYDHVRAAHARMQQADGRQQGDPGKITAALLDVINSPTPPLNLFLGSDAVERAGVKIQQWQDGLEQWKVVSHSTDFTV